MQRSESVVVNRLTTLQGCLIFSLNRQRNFVWSLTCRLACLISYNEQTLCHVDLLVWQEGDYRHGICQGVFCRTQTLALAGAQVIARDIKAGTDRREVCGSENYETAFLLLVRHAPKVLGFDLTVRAVVFARAFAFPFDPCL
jgi:hypothetical protein